MTQHSVGRTPVRPSGNEKCCQGQSRKTIAGVHDLGDEHKTSYFWDDSAGSARGRANRLSSSITLQRRCEFGARRSMSDRIT